MAVGANNVTLTYFLPSSFPTIFFQNTIDYVHLLFLWAVIKFKDIVGVSDLTVMATLTLLISLKLCKY
jgi:hypothetical protein